MERSTSWVISLDRPVSTTKLTSSIVMEVSATLVARTILTVPDGGLRYEEGGLVREVGVMGTWGSLNTP